MAATLTLILCLCFVAMLGVPSVALVGSAMDRGEGSMMDAGCGGRLPLKSCSQRVWMWCTGVHGVLTGFPSMQSCKFLEIDSGFHSSPVGCHERDRRCSAAAQVNLQ